jgi:hypothetical protein
MAQIIAGLKDTGPAYGVCQIAGGSFRKTCCQTVSDVAVKKCQEQVLANSAADNECAPHAVPCRFVRPVQCTIARITEKKRQQCCNSLKPQALGQLLAFCKKQVDSLSKGCQIEETPIPGPIEATPIPDPIEETPIPDPIEETPSPDSIGNLF